MNKQFTVSEVRDIARSLDGLSRQMLHVFADMLEAQEKAVPVAWCRFLVADESGPEGFDPGDIIDLDIHPHAERPEGNGWQAMFLDATQAQPPAASVTDAMVERAWMALTGRAGKRGYEKDYECMMDVERTSVRAALEAALDAQESPNG